MTGIGIGRVVEITLKGGDTARGPVVTYRQVGTRCEVAILTEDGERVRGVVVMSRDPAEGAIYSADTIARAVVAGTQLRMPVELQLKVLATAIVARGDAP